MEYLHVKEAFSSFLPLVWALKAVPQQMHPWKVLGGLSSTKGPKFCSPSHTVSYRLQVLVLQGQVLFESTIPPLLTFSFQSRMVLQNVVLEALCSQKPVALVSAGVRMSCSPPSLSPLQTWMLT